MSKQSILGKINFLPENPLKLSLKILSFFEDYMYMSLSQFGYVYTIDRFHTQVREFYSFWSDVKYSMNSLSFSWGFNRFQVFRFWVQRHKSRGIQFYWKNR
jgi:hypothetical protein